MVGNNSRSVGDGEYDDDDTHAEDVHIGSTDKERKVRKDRRTSEIVIKELLMKKFIFLSHHYFMRTI